MRYQRAFDLRRADAVSGYVEHVIVPAQYGDVSIFVSHSDVARHVAARNGQPVSFIARRVAPDGSQHVGKGPLEHQAAAHSRRR